MTLCDDIDKSRSLLSIGGELTRTRAVRADTRSCQTDVCARHRENDIGIRRKRDPRTTKGRIADDADVRNPSSTRVRDGGSDALELYLRIAFPPARAPRQMR